MTNPSWGEFELWITNRIGFQTIPPARGGTGDFESWITDRIYPENYAEAGDVLVIPAAASAAGATVDPSIELGSIAVTPDNAWVVTTTVDPTVIAPSLVVTLPERSASFALGERDTELELPERSATLRMR